MGGGPRPIPMSICKYAMVIPRRAVRNREFWMCNLGLALLSFQFMRFWRYGSIQPVSAGQYVDWGSAYAPKRILPKPYYNHMIYHMKQQFEK